MKKKVIVEKDGNLINEERKSEFVITEKKIVDSMLNGKYYFYKM